MFMFNYVLMILFLKTDYYKSLLYYYNKKEVNSRSIFSFITLLLILPEGVSL